MDDELDEMDYMTRPANDRRLPKAEQKMWTQPDDTKQLPHTSDKC